TRRTKSRHPEWGHREWNGQGGVASAPGMEHASDAGRVRRPAPHRPAAASSPCSRLIPARLPWPSTNLHTTAYALLQRAYAQTQIARGGNVSGLTIEKVLARIMIKLFVIRSDAFGVMFQD